VRRLELLERARVELDGAGDEFGRVKGGGGERDLLEPRREGRRLREALLDELVRVAEDRCEREGGREGEYKCAGSETLGGRRGADE
jgi:hypothetical protein